MTTKQYTKMAKDASPKSKPLINCAKAFVTGGLICVFAQILYTIFENYGFGAEDSSTCVSVILIGIAIVITALGVYDKIAVFGGAGSFVPITGFANAIAAPAIEFKTEGYIAGTGAKMFIIAGPVLLYGTLASIVYGIVLYVFKLV